MLSFKEVMEAVKADLRKEVLSDPMFRVSSASVTLKFAVVKNTEGKGAIKAMFFDFSASGLESAELVNEITINLEPLSDEIFLGNDEDTPEDISDI